MSLVRLASGHVWRGRKTNWPLSSSLCFPLVRQVMSTRPMGPLTHSDLISFHCDSTRYPEELMYLIVRVQHGWTHHFVTLWNCLIWQIRPWRSRAVAMVTRSFSLIKQLCHWHKQVQSNKKDLTAERSLWLWDGEGFDTVVQELSVAQHLKEFVFNSTTQIFVLSVRENVSMQRQPRWLSLSPHLLPCRS